MTDYIEGEDDVLTHLRFLQHYPSFLDNEDSRRQ